MMTQALAAPDVTEPAKLSGPLRQVAPEFAEVYEAHSRAIFYLCLRMLGEDSRAEDATHDVFLKAWRHGAQFEGRSAVRTWLYRIAINHCRNLQQTWAERHITATDDEFVLQSTLPDTESPLRVLEVKELGERIRRTLAQLPAEYRQLLLLVADEEMSYDTVAKVTEQSPDAVRGKLHRARKAFAAEFRKTA